MVIVAIYNTEHWDDSNGGKIQPFEGIRLFGPLPLFPAACICSYEGAQSAVLMSGSEVQENENVR